MKGLQKTIRIPLTLAAFGLALTFSAVAHAEYPDSFGSQHLLPIQNVIILIADGCGYNHVDATSFYQYGQKGLQVYESFPIQFAMTTYQVDGQYDPNLAWQDFDYVREGATDSAAAATAMATGVKTYSGSIGLDADDNPVMNVVERAEALGKATGVVTSVPFSHGTPAGFVAHNVSRDNFRQIAAEMIYESAVDVIMGCGHPIYDNDGRRRKPVNITYISEAVYVDLFNGLAGTDADRDGFDDPWMFIQTLEEFQNLAVGPAPKRVFALPAVFETLQQERRGNDKAAPYVVPLTSTVPTLEQMTRAALNVLDDDPDGFLVMIEGGAVDWAGHKNQSGRLIEEMIDFNKTVEAIVDWVEQNSSWQDTIVIVTSDHETGYLLGPRSGPQYGYVRNDIVNKGQGNLPGMEWHSPTHTNSLVPLFAKGCGDELFNDCIDGNDPVKGPYIDNTDIAKVVFALLNHPPVADAGEDRTTYAWLDGTADVLLDGNDSCDADADPLTYHWSWTVDGNSYEANGVTATINLPAGEHSIELVVNDTFADSCPDETVITVVGPVRSYLRILPRRLNRQSHNSKVLAILRLPAGIGKDHIDANQPLLLYPPHISSGTQYISKFGRNGIHAAILAFFGKADITTAVTDDGPVAFDLVGKLRTGQYFFGSDTVTIAPYPPRRHWRHTLRKSYRQPGKKTGH